MPMVIILWHVLHAVVWLAAKLATVVVVVGLQLLTHCRFALIITVCLVGVFALCISTCLTG